MIDTPRQLGYHMPAEWERHAATWLSWPHNPETWPGKFEPIPEIFAGIVRELSAVELVRISVCDDGMAETARALLSARGAVTRNVRLHRIPTNDAWCRDHGPTFLVRERKGVRELAAVDWNYNAWGGKYPPYDLDDQVPSHIAGVLNIPRFVPGVVMEGGALEVNGAGTLLTSESCLLNPNRNPTLTRTQIEDCLREYLGITQIIWLGAGIQGDDTDGHVDDLARFVDENTIVTVDEEDPADENFAPLRDNLERLRRARDPFGHPFEIVTLPMPPPASYHGQRLPCSYANFYIANNLVLVPTYHAESDAVALQTLQRLFPRHRITGLDCTDLVWGLGAIHCLTQQQPS